VQTYITHGRGIVAKGINPNKFHIITTMAGLITLAIVIFFLIVTTTNTSPSSPLSSAGTHHH
jgi:hypothetical protein